MDMRESIVPKSDQMNAEDLLVGPRTFTIADVRPGATNEQPVKVFLAEFAQGRPWTPSKTMRRLLVFAWGPDSDAYLGKRITLYRDPEVKFGGQEVGGIKISHMSGIPKKLTVKLTETKGRRAPHVVEPLPDSAPVEPPSPMDQLVWAMNAAKIPADDRLSYCQRVIPREGIMSAADLSPGEIDTVVSELKDAIQFEREQEQGNG